MRLLKATLASIFLMLSTNFLYAEDSNLTTQEEQIIELYIATFNRAPDRAGLDYWLNEMQKNHWTNETVAKSMFMQKEALELYGDGDTDRFITSVYKNVLNRDPDEAGKAYWKKELESGNIPKEKFIIAILNGAKAQGDESEDVKLLKNKIEVAKYFALEKGLNNPVMAKRVIANVTSSKDSVTKIEQEIEEAVSINGTNNHFNLDDYPVSANLSQELKDALAHMGNEERLAHDLYMNLYNYYKDNMGLEIKQFYNIATNSETKHVSTVQSLVKRYDLNVSDFTNVDANIVESNNMSADNMPSGVYDIPAIQELYDTLYSMGVESQEDALKVGCMVEVTDINDLDEYIELAQESNASDIVAAFESLRDASYRHYWAFDKGLKNIGVVNGCYYEGDPLLTNKEGIYPKEENGQKGKGNGQGNGTGYQYGRQ